MILRRNWVLRAAPSQPDSELSVRLAAAFNRQRDMSYFFRMSANRNAYFFERSLELPVMFIVVDRREIGRAHVS